MTCSIEKIQALQIREEYKQGLMQMCQDPANAEACAELCTLSPDEMAEAFTQIEMGLQKSAEDGSFEAMMSDMQVGDPQLDAFQSQGVASIPRGVQGFANGGLATIHRYNDDQLAHVESGEMVVPKAVLANNPQLESGIASAIADMGADPERYRVGGVGSINPYTGFQEFGFGSFISSAFKSVAKVVKKAAPLVAAVVAPQILPGLAGSIGLGAATAGFSPLAWSAIGSGLATKLSGGSWGDALKSGAMTYAGGKALQGIGKALSPAPVPGGPQVVDLTTQAGAPVGEVPGFTTAAAPTNTITSPLGIEHGTSAMDLMAAQPTTLPSIPSATSPTTQVALGDLATAAAPATQTGIAGLMDKAQGAWDWAKTPLYTGESEVLQALSTPLSLGAGALAMTGGMEPEAVERPAGYDYSDPQAQYGYHPFETRSGQLMAGVGEQGIGSIRQPIGQVTPAGATGYRFGQPTTQIAQPTAYLPALQAAMQPFGATPSYAQLANGGYVSGPGTETSDSIPAALSDGEFVMTAKAVRGAGGGSLKEGARKMYEIMDQLERRMGQ